MESYFCPDKERFVTIVIDQHEARRLNQALGNASRWEDLGDAELSFRDICRQFDDHLAQIDYDLRTDEYPEDDSDVEVEGIPNVLEDIGEDDS